MKAWTFNLLLSTNKEQRLEENKIIWRLEYRLDNAFRGSSRNDTCTERARIMGLSLPALE
jgi:hypothetical protein